MDQKDLVKLARLRTMAARAPAPRPDPEEAARQARRAAVDARYVGRLR